MKFKGTWIFTLVVVAAVGVAIWDYNNQQGLKEKEAKESLLLQDFSMSSVSQVQFKSAAAEFQLESDSGLWKMNHPVQDLVDYESLEGFLQGLAEQDMAEVPVEGNVNWAQYGLENPEAVVELTLNDGKKVKIEVGSERAYNDGYYVRKNSENKLYLGSTSWTTYLSKSANDMRNKDLYSADSDYQGLEVQQGKKKLSFALNEGKWVSKGNKGILISERALEEYFNLVRHLRADAIVADDTSSAAKKLYNLNRPAMSITVQTSEKGAASSWRAIFSEPKNNEVFVSIGKNKPVYRIQARKMDSLKKDFVYFRDKAYPFGVVHTDMIPGFRIKRKNDRREFMFQKSNGKWILSVEEPHKKVNELGITNMFNDLRGLRVKEFIGGPDAKVKPKGKYGLILLDALGEITFEMHWGDEEKINEDKRVKVWTTLSNETFWVDAADFNVFEAHNLLLPDMAGKSDQDKESN